MGIVPPFPPTSLYVVFMICVLQPELLQLPRALQVHPLLVGDVSEKLKATQHL